tara:strand:+ start:3210 stop:3548 length:339 start_codon:yes stop_codon:yes gene_type:complete
MPLIKVLTSLPEIEFSQKLLNELSNELSKITGKPTEYVMTLLQTNVQMTFAESSEPSCFVEIKSIGSLKPALISESFCKLIYNFTNIPANRIYISFEDVKPSDWGFNGRTFG